MPSHFVGKEWFMTLCRPSSLLESDQEPQPFRGGRRVWNGKLHSDHWNPSWGFPHGWSLLWPPPFSSPKRVGSQKIFQGQFASQKSACPRGKADEKPSIDTIETSGNPQFKGVDEPWTDPSCFMPVGKVGYVFNKQTFPLHVKNHLMSWNNQPATGNSFPLSCHVWKQLGFPTPLASSLCATSPCWHAKKKTDISRTKLSQDPKKTKPNALCVAYLFHSNSFLKHWKKNGQKPNHQHLFFSTPSLLKAPWSLSCSGLVSVPSWCPQGCCVAEGDLEWKGGQFHNARFEVFEVITPEADNELQESTCCCHVKTEKTAQKKR